MPAIPCIVLPKDKDYLTVEVIPGLIAAALYRERQRTVSFLRKELDGSNRDAELSSADWDHL
jgi:hypothetical protein